MIRLMLLTFVLIGAACQAAAAQAVETPDLPNRTKVVRLIIVPDRVSPTDANAVSQLVAAEGAAKTDVFIVRDKAKGWHPMSLLNGQLVDHDEVTRRDRETTVFVMVSQREQIQWESSVPFRIAAIVKKDSVPETSLINSEGDTPGSPFGDRPFKGTGGPGRPIRSGTASLNGNRPYNQLYKVSFVLTLDGQDVEIDPDVYCDWM